MPRTVQLIHRIRHLGSGHDHGSDGNDSGHGQASGHGRHGGHGGHDNSGFECSKAAGRYDRTARLMRPLYRRIAADIAKGTPYGARVLDIGTGPGRLLSLLGGKRPDLDLTGVDPSAAMIDIAAARTAELGDRARAVTGDAGALPFPDASFDLIVTSFSLHHWPDVPAAAAEIARVLRPEGHLGVYDFRRAPFDDLAEALTAQPALAGRTVRRGRMPGGLPFHLFDRQTL